MGILEGKNILVAGLTMNTSIAYEVARIAQTEGATVLVSDFGRALSLTNRVVQKLDPVPPVLDLDVTNAEALAGLADSVREHVDHLDGDQCPHARGAPVAHRHLDPDWGAARADQAGRCQAGGRQ